MSFFFFLPVSPIINYLPAVPLLFSCVMSLLGVGSGADNLFAVRRSHVRNRRPHAHGEGRDTAARHHPEGTSTIMYDSTRDVHPL